MRKNKIAFANFNCTFGSRDLKDLLEEVVLPSFQIDEPILRRGNSYVVFLYTKREEVELDDTREDVIHGKILYAKKITSSQYLTSDMQLKRETRELDSAPSSTFILLLNTHRLIYFAETDNAPSLDKFEKASRRALKVAYDRFIATLVINKYYTKAAAKSEFENPVLDIVEFTEKDSFNSFLERFSKLKKLEIHFFRPNGEYHYADFFETVSDTSEYLGAKSTQCKIENGRNGLNKDAVRELAAPAAEKAEQKIYLDGIDTKGRKIKGTNKNFMLIRDFLPLEAVGNVMINLISYYRTLVKTGDLPEEHIHNPQDKVR